MSLDGVFFANHQPPTTLTLTPCSKPGEQKKKFAKIPCGERSTGCHGVLCSNVPTRLP